MDSLDLAGVLGDPASRLGAQRFGLAADIDEHSHAFVEVTFVIGGRGVHRSVRGARELSRGAFVVVRPGTWHAYDDVDRLEVINLYLVPDILHRELAWVLDYPAVAAALLLAGESAGKLSDPAVERVTGWLHDLESADHLTGPTAIGLATSALGELAAADFGSTGEPRSAVSPAVRTAMRLMQDDLRVDWTIDRLAHQARVSPSALHRLFRREIGRPPLTWLTRARGERAAALLATSDLAVAQIGAAVGWDDPSYASRRFRQLYGISPSAYRSRFARESTPTP